MWVCVCVSECGYVWVCVCDCVYVWIYECVYVWVYIDMCEWMYMWVSMYMFVCVCLCKCVYMSVCLRVSECIYVHVCMWECVFICEWVLTTASIWKNRDSTSPLCTQTLFTNQNQRLLSVLCIEIHHYLIKWAYCLKEIIVKRQWPHPTPSLSTGVPLVWPGGLPMPSLLHTDDISSGSSPR